MLESEDTDEIIQKNTCFSLKKSPVLSVEYELETTSCFLQEFLTR